MLCDDLEEWDGGSEMGGGFKREEIYIYIYTQLVHFVVRQKLTQHCKAIILQLKTIKKVDNVMFRNRHLL